MKRPVQKHVFDHSMYVNVNDNANVDLDVVLDLDLYNRWIDE